MQIKKISLLLLALFSSTARADLTYIGFDDIKGVKTTFKENSSKCKGSWGGPHLSQTVVETDQGRFYYNDCGDVEFFGGHFYRTLSDVLDSPSFQKCLKKETTYPDGRIVKEYGEKKISFKLFIAEVENEKIVRYDSKRVVEKCE